MSNKMNKKSTRDNLNRNRTRFSRTNEKSIITSPYNFIELNKTVFPAYEKDIDLPDSRKIIPELISGEIIYTIETKTPLIFENGLEELTASNIRGLVRSNLQVLGYTSLFTDIEDTTYKFRSFYGSNKKLYDSIMGNSVKRSTSGYQKEYSNIRAGLLRHDNNGYYIVPGNFAGGKGFIKLNIRKIQRNNTDWRSRFNVSYNNIKNIFDSLPNTAAYTDMHNRSVKNGKDIYEPFIKKVSWDGNENTVLAVGEVGKFPYNAYIINSGQIYGSVSLYLVPLVIESKQECKYRINNNTIWNYRQHLTMCTNPRDWSFYDLPQIGCEKPVFYVINGERIEFGFTMLFPVSYKHSVHDGIPSSHKQGTIDYDKALFGFRGESGSYNGRLSFLNPVIDKRTSLEEERIVCFAAKPHSTTCYVMNDESLGYNSDNFELRGVKHYWLKEKPQKMSDNYLSDRISTIVSGYGEGTNFRGKVFFYNLREDELGLLVWSIGLNEQSQQNIGAGKQYGYGRVKITVDEVRCRQFLKQYASEKINEWSYDYLLLEPSYYIGVYQEKLDSFLGGKLKIDRRLQDFFEIKNADNMPDANKTHYAELFDFRKPFSFPKIKDVSEAKEWLIVPEHRLKSYASMPWEFFINDPPDVIKNSYPEYQIIEVYQHLNELLELFKCNRKYVIRYELVQEYLEIQDHVKMLLPEFQAKREKRFSLLYDNHMKKCIEIIESLNQQLEFSREQFIVSSVPDIEEISNSLFYNKTARSLVVNLELKLGVESVPIKIRSVKAIKAEEKVWELNQIYYVDGGTTFPIELLLPVSEEDEKRQYLIYELRLEYEARLKGKHHTMSYEAIKEAPITFQDYTLLANPYSSWLGNAVSDSNMFFGRDELLADIMEKINCCSVDSLSGRNIVIYGQKRTGKSTILYFVKRMLESIPEHYVVIDLGNTASILGTKPNQSKGNYTISLRYFFDKMVSSVEDALEEFHEDLYDDLEDEGFLFPRLKQMDDADAMSSCSNFFEKLVDRITPDKRIVVLIDEFTYFYDLILKQQLDENFMRFWKAFIQNTKICAVLVGQDFMEDFRNAYPNEFGASDFIRISYLDKTSTEQLICKPFKRVNGYDGFSANAVERIYELTSGNAFFTMKMCSELVAYLNEEKKARVITEFSVNSFLRNHWFNINSNKRVEKAFFESLYNDGNHREWDDDNIQLLYGIADHCRNEGYADKHMILMEYGDESDNFVNDRIIIPVCKEKLEHLIYREVLVEEKGRLHIKVLLLAEWLLARYSK